MARPQQTAVGDTVDVARTPAEKPETEKLAKGAAGLLAPSGAAAARSSNTGANPRRIVENSEYLAGHEPGGIDIDVFALQCDGVVKRFCANERIGEPT